MASHEHDAHDDHHDGLGHVVPMKVLLGVFGALLFLTVVTVLAAQVHFGSKGLNLAIAMLIATVKVTLVVLYFMHLRWDKLFHTVVLVAAILGAVLFVGFALMDRGQYEDQVIWDPSNPPAAAPRAPAP